MKSALSNRKLIPVVTENMVCVAALPRPRMAGWQPRRAKSQVCSLALPVQEELTTSSMKRLFVECTSFEIERQRQQLIRDVFAQRINE